MGAESPTRELMRPPCCSVLPSTGGCQPCRTPRTPPLPRRLDWYVSAEQGERLELDWLKGKQGDRKKHGVFGRLTWRRWDRAGQGKGACYTAPFHVRTHVR